MNLTARAVRRVVAAAALAGAAGLTPASALAEAPALTPATALTRPRRWPPPAGSRARPPAPAAPAR